MKFVIVVPSDAVVNDRGTTQAARVELLHVLYGRDWILNTGRNPLRPTGVDLDGTEEPARDWMSVVYSLDGPLGGRSRLETGKGAL